MQSALRLAARRAAGVSSRCGASTTATATSITTTTEAEREWVTSLVRREVRAQMLAAEERAAVERAMKVERAREAERSARRRAWKLVLEGPLNDSWTNGFVVGYLATMIAGSFVTQSINNRNR